MAGTTSLAVIAVSGLNWGSANALPQVAAAIRGACMGQGFFYVSGHGVPEAVIDAAAAASRNFFRLPAEQKALGARMMRAVAVSLGLEEKFFVSRHRKPLQRTQAIFYPPQDVEAEEEVFGVAPHTDFGCITLLWPDGNGRLQVRERQSGGWINAPLLPDTLVVNVGGRLRRWSNDRFASTPHRVVNRSGQERMSIATFHDPNFGAMIDPRELGTPEGEAHHEPVTAGQHILNRFDQSFGYRKTLAAAG
jgi:isopenicillin N synthase-like dioxygenase